MIPAERSHLRAAGSSHPGMSGKNNEDRYAVSAFQLSERSPVPVVLAIVSDGIGGHRAGEVAAEMAVETIRETIMAGDISQPAETLREAIVLASNRIYEQSETEANQKGMGATCACALVIGDRLYTATVGDSRIYLIRSQSIRQISIDHTWIQEALDNGVLRPEEARGHPNSHVIRRYLGSRQPVVPDTRIRLDPRETDEQAEANQGLLLQPGDQVVLCSDGLTDLVNENEILAIVQSQEPEAALEELTNLANQRGGHDNITIVTLQVPEGVTAPVAVATPRARPAGQQATRPVAKPAAQPVARPAAKPEAKRRSPLAWTCLGASLVLVAALVGGGLFWFASGADFDLRRAFAPLLEPVFGPLDTATAAPTAPATTTPPAAAETTIPGTPSPDALTATAGTTSSPFSPSPTGTLPASASPSTGVPSTAPAATLTPWPTNTPTP